jgi:hypothetical protein
MKSIISQFNFNAYTNFNTSNISFNKLNMTHPHTDINQAIRLEASDNEQYKTMKYIAVSSLLVVS